MADVSKDRLRKEITAILKNADLTKTSAKKVRKQLEEKLDVDLADQKKVVDELVMEILKDKKTDKKKDSDEDEDEDGENGGAGGGEDEEEEEEEEEDSDKEKKKKAPKRSASKKSKGSDSEEVSEDEDEDEYSPKKKAKTSAKKAGKKKKKGSDSDSDEDWAKKKGKKSGGGGGGGRKGAGGGYTKPCTLSPDLAKLVGQDTMPRHEVVKKIWAIIKERNLYDPRNKQFAICDNELLKVFGVKRFRTFGMMKYLKDHFVS